MPVVHPIPIGAYRSETVSRECPRDLVERESDDLVASFLAIEGEAHRTASRVTAAKAGSLTDTALVATRAISARARAGRSRW